MGLQIEKTGFDYETEVDKQQKKHRSMYSFLQLLGLFIFGGWGVMFFTVPMDLNQTFEWVQVKSIHINGNMKREFLLCLITVGGIYFGLLYLYFKKMWGRKRLLITLLCLSVVDGILFILSL
jgi:hypothetical protein